MPEQFRESVDRLREATRQDQDEQAANVHATLALFASEVAAAPGFNMAGVRSKHPELRARVEAAVEELVGPQPATRMLMLHVGDLWHGLVESTEGGLVFYFFESLDSGLVGTPEADLVAAISLAQEREHLQDRRPA